jgi:hypothetical protein
MIAHGRVVAAAHTWEHAADRTLALLRAVHRGATVTRSTRAAVR